jgi:hypothetical protein
MGSGSANRAASGDLASSSDALNGAIDRLYAAPLDGFVALRKTIATELRAAGDAAAAKLVLAIAKPSRTAWALDQVARRRPELVKAALDAHADAQKAQGHADGEAMRASARIYRDRVAEVVEAAAGFVRDDGGGLPAVQLRRVGATVQAVASGGDAELRDKLLRGRLGSDVDDDDPFAGMELGEVREKPRAAAPRDARATHDAHEGGARKASEAAAHARAAAEWAEARDRARKDEAVEKARAKLTALEVEAKEARASAREAEVAASRAQAEAERARRAVEGVEKRLEEARRTLRAASA